MNDGLRANLGKRYFEYQSKPVILYGAGSWGIIFGTEDGIFMDYRDEIDNIVKYRGNLIRVAAFHAGISMPEDEICLYPWKRSGKGEAKDGESLFDLNEFDEEYWRRLKDVTAYAKDKGVSILLQMLGETDLESSTHAAPKDIKKPRPTRWAIHPMNPDNNINSLEGLNGGNGPAGEGFFNLKNEKIRRIQEAYFKKILDETSNYGNIIYELSNEYLDSHRFIGVERAWEWAKYWVEFFQEYGKEHGVTPIFTNMGWKEVMKLHAEHPGVQCLDVYWTSRECGNGDVTKDGWLAYGKPLTLGRVEQKPGYTSNTSADPETVNKGRKTFWRAFTCGVAGATFKARMAPHGLQPSNNLAGNIILNLHEFADKIAFWDMEPNNALVNRGYCLANVGEEYVVYLPGEGEVSLDMHETSGTFGYYWYDPRDGLYLTDMKKVKGGSKVAFSPPYQGDWVLYVKKT